MKENDVNVNERTVSMNPVPPKLKGLVKLHKETRPMRPLVNCIQSPCYKIAILKENYQFETRHNIRNILKLIEALNKLKIKSNNKLISLDFTNM